jgi:hypothetical protein
VTTPQAVMIAALLAVAVIHVKSRIGGALATAGWCVAAAIFGAWALGQREDGVIFLGIQTPKWVYYAVIGSVFLYQCAVVGRALTRRVAPKNGSGSMPTTPPTPPPT